MKNIEQLLHSDKVLIVASNFDDIYFTFKSLTDNRRIELRTVYLDSLSLTKQIYGKSDDDLLNWQTGIFLKLFSVVS